MKTNTNCKLSGQGLVVVIIVLALIGGGLWYLYSTKAATDREAREFARETVKRLMVDHDRQYLENRLGPQAKLDLPPSQRDYMIQRFAQFGVPSQPIQIDEKSGPGEAHIKEGHQTLAPGQHLGLVAALG